jgi:hypothetical protein
MQGSRRSVCHLRTALEEAPLAAQIISPSAIEAWACPALEGVRLQRCLIPRHRRLHTHHHVQGAPSRSGRLKDRQ